MTAATVAGWPMTVARTRLSNRPPLCLPDNQAKQEDHGSNLPASHSERPVAHGAGNCPQRVVVHALNDDFPIPASGPDGPQRWRP
jgi:hypothetical protein